MTQYPATWQHPAARVFVGAPGEDGAHAWDVVPARQGMPELVVDGPDGRRWVRVPDGPRRAPEPGAPSGPWWYVPREGQVPAWPYELPAGLAPVLNPPRPDVDDRLDDEDDAGDD